MFLHIHFNAGGSLCKYIFSRVNILYRWVFICVFRRVSRCKKPAKTYIDEYRFIIRTALLYNKCIKTWEADEMHLLITVFAAVIVTVKWYRDRNNELLLGSLVLMLWGASLMWLTDAIFEFAELKADYFAPEISDMTNDAFLGLSVLALALIVWVVRLLIKDPSGRVREALKKKN